MSKSLEDEEKHFKTLEVSSFVESKDFVNELKERSFADITFEQISVLGDVNVENIHVNAFGETSKRIQSFVCESCFLKNIQSLYPINRLPKLKSLAIGFNNTDIPTNAITTQVHILLISGTTFTIRYGAFQYLNHLTTIGIPFAFVKKFQRESFRFIKPSNQTLTISFMSTFVKADSFENGTFNYLQRPVNIMFEFDSATDYIPENVFKSVLDNKQNKITFFRNSRISCENCGNQWLIRDDKQQQIQNPVCIENVYKQLFDSEVVEKLKLKCG